MPAPNNQVKYKNASSATDFEYEISWMAEVHYWQIAAKGLPTEDELTTAVSFCIDFVTENGATSLLYNEKERKGDFAYLREFFLNEILRGIQRGLRCIAIVSPKEIDTQIGTLQVLSGIPGNFDIDIKMFQELATAQKWLEDKCRIQH